MNLSTIVAAIYLVGGVFLFFLAVVIFRENPKAQINRITSLMLFFAGLGPLLGALGTIAKDISPEISRSIFYTNIFYLWELFFPQLLLFSFVFPEKKKFLFDFPKVKWLLFLPHIFHIFLMLIFYDPDSWVRSLESWKTGFVFGWLLEPFAFVVKIFATLMGVLYSFHLQFFSVVNLIYLFLAVFFLYLGYKKVKIQRLKRQVKFLVRGIWSATGLYALAFIIPVLTPIKISDNLKYFLTITALVVGGSSIAWAIIKHQFLDIRLLVRQSLVYSLTSGLLVGLYFLVVVQLGKAVQGFLGRPTPILEISYVILALVFFQPIMGQLDNFIKRMFIRDTSDYRNMMETFSRKIITIFDFDQLKETVFDTLKRNMLVEKVFLCIYQDNEGKFILFAEEGRFYFEKNDKFLLSLKGKKNPVYIDELEIKTDDTPMSKLLFPGGLHLAVPLSQKEELIGFIGLSQKATRFRFTYEDLTLLNVLANQLVVAIDNAKLYAESLEKQKLEEELLVARQIQLALLPKTLPTGEGFEVSAYIQPARQVGGDYYDFIKTGDESFGIAIADATGKGIPAALLVSLLHASLRAEAKNSPLPNLVISNVNQLIYSSTSTEKFATMFYGEFDPQKRSLCYCNAGHNYPVLLRKSGEIEFLKEGGLILGAFAFATYEKSERFLDSEDILVFYSDGLTEAFNKAEEQFGEKRLLDLLEASRHQTADEIKNILVQEVNNFSRGATFWDDFTLVVLKVC